MIDMHRPERWGIVEFAAENEPRRDVQPNTDDTARDVLMEVYYLQRQFHSVNKRYAATYAELVPIAKAAGLKPRRFRKPEM